MLLQILLLSLKSHRLPTSLEKGILSNRVHCSETSSSCPWEIRKLLSRNLARTGRTRKRLRLSQETSSTSLLDLELYRNIILVRYLRTVLREFIIVVWNPIVITVNRNLRHSDCGLGDPTLLDSCQINIFDASLLVPEVFIFQRSFERNQYITKKGTFAWGQLPIKF